VVEALCRFRKLRLMAFEKGTRRNRVRKIIGIIEFALGFMLDV
jgi:hypothetical protein